MKQITIILFLFDFLSLSAQNINSGYWKIKNSVIIHNNDTAYIFDHKASNNYYDLSNISYSFNSINEYEGTSIDKTTMIGSWNFPTSDSMDLDGIVSHFNWKDSNVFEISIPFLLKDTSGNIDTATSALRFYNIPITKFNFTVSPNPFNELLGIKIESPSSFDASISVVNSLGQSVYSIPMKSYSSINNLSIDLGFLEKGIYYLTIVRGKIKGTKKIIKL